MNRQELIQQIKQKQSFLCVGLDTDLNKIPKSLMGIVKEKYEEEEYTYGMLLEFNTRIIDATAPYCVAYKPNLAFYEAYDGSPLYGRRLRDTIPGLQRQMGHSACSDF